MNNLGWVDHLEFADEVQEQLSLGVFGDAARHLVGSGEGKDSLLFKVFDVINRKYPTLHQLSAPSCVAFACAGGVNLLKAVEIAHGDNEEYITNTSQMDLYWGSRCIIGKNRLKGRGGSIVAWCVKYMVEYGTLLEQKYGNIDLTYDPKKCVRWGNDSGAPKTLADLAKDHPILEFSRVKSWEDFRDSIYNKMPVMIGSKYGYSNSTDKDNFCRQNTTWNHAMLGCGMSDNKKRPYGVIANSWGTKWLKQNGKPGEIPLGAFKSDANNIDKMCRNGDAWSISNFKGYEIDIKIDTDTAW